MAKIIFQIPATQLSALSYPFPMATISLLPADNQLALSLLARHKAVLLAGGGTGNGAQITTLVGGF